jgi:hypothetical protein
MVKHADYQLFLISAIAEMSDNQAFQKISFLEHLMQLIENQAFQLFGMLNYCPKKGYIWSCPCFGLRLINPVSSLYINNFNASALTKFP